MIRFDCISIRRAFLAAASPAAALLLFTGRGEAQTTTFYACYVPATGTVYRIREPGLRQQCGEGKTDGKQGRHVEFSWTNAAPDMVNGAPSASGGGKEVDHGGLIGLSDDDHSQYLLADGVRQSTDGFAVTGTSEEGSIPASGPGVRLMWYPGKAAFRAGRIIDDRWDDAYIGDGSAAFGSFTLASGLGSFAAGSAATATGAYATGFGQGVTASGTGSFAAGRFTMATALAATAMGQETVASGGGALAIGFKGIASGGGAIALGSLLTASGPGATAVGNKSEATGEYSTVIGTESRASGNWSVALGYKANTNDQHGAIAMSTYVPNQGDVKAVAQGQLVMRAMRFWLGNTENVTAPGGRLIQTSTGAYLSTGGAWVSSSDVHLKTAFQDVDEDEILEKVAALPISSWSYRAEEEGVRHVGPTAQDFHAAFGLGDTDRAIANVDADGISLAAIQALDRRTAELPELVREVEEQRNRIRELEAAVGAMRSELLRIQAQVEQR